MDIGVGIIWLILAILVGVYASRKGSSGFGYFILSIILSPLIGFLIALLIKEKKPAIEELKNAKLLFDEGIITEEEYNKKKETLKSKMRPKVTTIVTDENNAKLLASLSDEDMVTVENNIIGLHEIIKFSRYKLMVEKYGE